MKQLWLDTEELESELSPSDTEPGSSAAATGVSVSLGCLSLPLWGLVLEQEKQLHLNCMLNTCAGASAGRC